MKQIVKNYCIQSDFYLHVSNATTVYYYFLLLYSLCELPEIRLDIASNSQIIEQMYSICLSPSFEHSFIHRVVMVFLDLSYTHETHPYLTSHKEFTAFMKFELTTTGFFSTCTPDLIRCVLHVLTD